MGFGIHGIQHNTACTNLNLLPFGVLSADIKNVDVSGKRPVMSFGGKIASKTKLNVDSVRYDFCSKQAYVQISSAKNDTGAKGQVVDYDRQVELDISTKRARATGECWQIHLVNPQGKILDTQVQDFRQHQHC